MTVVTQAKSAKAFDYARPYFLHYDKDSNRMVAETTPGLPTQAGWPGICYWARSAKEAVDNFITDFAEKAASNDF
jgi:hypothetical protein